MPILSLIAAGTLATAPGGALVVRFENLAPQGQVQVAVFDGPEAWKLHRKPVRSATLKLSGRAAEVKFDLAPGAYGVMAYHDRNANGRLDTLPIGLPTEPYGFSNDARGTFGPPAWAASMFEVRTGRTAVQTIRLK